MLVCSLPILITFGWDGGSRVHTRLPRLRQGMIVCVHTSMDMEQQSDHKLIRPSGMELLVCGAGSRPSYHLGVVRRNVPTGVNLEPLRWFKIHASVGIAITNPCSAHRIRLSSLVSCEFRAILWSSRFVACSVTM